jgi:type I restriction enzyme M protein
LSKQGGVIGAIFLKAQNEIQDPAKLKRLVGLIDSEVWLGLPVDVKGNIYRFRNVAAALGEEPG